MPLFSIEWVCEVLKSPLVGNPNTLVESVSIDTRTLQPGALFFALAGEHTDGHRFLQQAAERGAVAAVVKIPLHDLPIPQIVVPDTLRALGDLAAHYRRRFPIPLVGITGSVGKTSTKELTAALLRTRYTTLSNPKNLNTEIGVPLTLFQLASHHEVAVIEMGMRGLGQIDRLAEIASPNIGVITKIGYAHIELLGSREKIAEAKSELLARLPADGIAVLPAECDFLPYLRSRVASTCRIITFSGTGSPADVSVKPLEAREKGSLRLALDLHGHRYTVQMTALGSHQAHNAAAALAVALALDVPLEKALTALSQWPGAEGRMTSRRAQNGACVLDDCYNAGVESMLAALQTLASLTGPENRVAVLGDMKELGDFALKAHQMVGQAVAQIGLRLLITVGDLAQQIAEEANRNLQPGEPILHQHFPTSEEAAKNIGLHIRPSDTVLVKGSRAMQMEQIVSALTGTPTGETHA
ncbi:UDP-N-acetylmuramoyl-tripeptide--D-alanyl-D-alanine ligase [Chthonomonas calidirosea]|uniref:UDP-N-acetylmuramoyl-tripeptide--D-alanyl-D- alanine ligase n=1 Tax=Chthonomonas calidirosea TaxID=454171 RepID=UPI0006ECA217|nr:UDP-N-acetylmuramoyl-tripeptide--D-alanyl-D-alanine ligase [Chthonomonas calidirosea]CEK12761.1 UDP-N-acetylmuramoyl-tripeptide--D-alanyl-D-alanine ligase [Chthonomonas calidirosea]